MREENWLQPRWRLSRREDWDESRFAEPILFPKLRICFADFPYLLCSIDEGKMKRTLERELRVFEIAESEANGATWLFFCWWLLGYVPGGAPFSSAEQWCQRRYGHSHRVMVFIIKMKQKHAQKGHLNNKTKQRTSQHCDFVAQVVKKRALVKSQQKAPTPEWEDASSTSWGGGLWWDPVGKHLRQSGKVQCCKPRRFADNSQVKG